MRSGLLDNICNPANTYFTYSIWLFNVIYREENLGKKLSTEIFMQKKTTKFPDQGNSRCYSRGHYSFTNLRLPASEGYSNISWYRLSLVYF